MLRRRQTLLALVEAMARIEGSHASLGVSWMGCLRQVTLGASRAGLLGVDGAGGNDAVVTQAEHLDSVRVGHQQLTHGDSDRGIEVVRVHLGDVVWWVALVLG